MRSALSGLTRFICTPRVAKHRLFVWFNSCVYPDSATFVIARSDDTTFGILHSRFHELWSLRLGTSLEDRPRYTPTTTFETFPFPAGLTPRDTASRALQAGCQEGGGLNSKTPAATQPHPNPPLEGEGARAPSPGLMIISPAADETAWRRALDDLAPAVFIADPLGNVMMRYDEPIDARSVLRDMERLLKYSWVR